MPHARPRSFSGTNAGSLLHGMLGLELVAHAPNCAQVAWPRGVYIDLLTESAHVNCHRATVTTVAVVPDVLEELLAREALLGMRGEEVEKVELFGGEMQLYSITHSLSQMRTNHEITHA